MTVLFGHPTGNPNSHHAALAYFEADRLEAFCTAWMPSETVLGLLARLPPLRAPAQRLGRRRFAPLDAAPKIEGAARELRRLAIRALGLGHEGLAYDANDWLMRTMARECSRDAVRAVHAYEDCSILQFEQAKRLDKACIYELPIGYYSAWQAIEPELLQRYAEWVPPGGLPSSHHVRPWQKRSEMALADLVLVPGPFVERTVRDALPYKRTARVPYGVDSDFWRPAPVLRDPAPLRFIHAGHVSLRKGMPVLLEAWRKAALADAALELVGAWQLADAKRALPPGASWRPAQSPAALRERFHAADVFVFPSFFEGFGLALFEALACGLPAIASEAITGPDALPDACGYRVPAGDVDALVDALRWFDRHRDALPAMRSAARAHASAWTWERYRRVLLEATAAFDD